MRIYFSIVFALMMPFFAYADNNDITVYLFYGDGCPHCAHEEAFLDTLEAQGAIRAEYLEVWHHDENRKLLEDVAERLGLVVSGVPITVVRDKAFVGWRDEATSGAQLSALVSALRGSDAPDIVADIRAGSVSVFPDEGDSSVLLTTSDASNPLNANDISQPSTSPNGEAMPVVAGISVADMSLPFATALFGFLDGFNPCAMWALVFLITLLFGMKDRKKMWILGGTFIFVSGLVYYFFLAAWLNVMFVLGYLSWIRAIIGVVALGGGAWYLYEWKTAPVAGCVVTNEQQKERLLERMRDAIGQKSFLVSLAGIAIVAVMINAVELVCSAGLPAIYTQLLTMHTMSPALYYGYILLYVLFFMLDDIIVFGAAMVTLRLTGLSARYTRMSHLVGGLLMVLIGLLLILKPELLMFG
jgi:hypothetical protein